MNADLYLDITTADESAANIDALIAARQAAYDRLIGLGLEVIPVPATSENAHSVTIKDGNTYIRQSSYMPLHINCIAELNRLAELKDIELQLKALRLRAAELGVEISSGQKESFRVAWKNGTMATFDATYEQLWEVADRLAKMEVTQLIMGHYMTFRRLGWDVANDGKRWFVGEKIVPVSDPISANIACVAAENQLAIDTAPQLPTGDIV